MSRAFPFVFLCVAGAWAVTASFSTVAAADLTLSITGAPRSLRLVGVVQRWDQDGNPVRPVDPKAKIESPFVTAKGTSAGNGKWIFKGLKAGMYDVILLADPRIRIEGFNYPPVLEFDPFFAGDTQIAEEHRDWILEDIAASRHYENKVEPLYIGGNDKTARVLVMLIRDKPTSYEGHFPGAATIRHEVWQYDWAYGGWKKNKRTRVLDRCMLHRDELRQWTWLWDPKLGGIEIKSADVTIEYAWPDIESRSLKGLYPY